LEVSDVCSIPPTERGGSEEACGTGVGGGGREGGYSSLTLNPDILLTGDKPPASTVTTNHEELQSLDCFLTSFLWCIEFLEGEGLEIRRQVLHRLSHVHALLQRQQEIVTGHTHI
jgi:hypothetical protein